MDNCIFCKIISGEIPSSKVYEDDKVLAFLDISQATKGHTLVIPKEHVRNILEMSAETAETVFSRVPKIARAVQKATAAIGMNILNNNEEVAGQTVFHAHIHLVPRYGADDGAYKRREDIKEEILDLNQSRENISHDLDNIKRNLDIIKEQNLVLADIKQDLNYKTRVFKKDLEPRLNIIQERLQKYQGDDKE